MIGYSLVVLVNWYGYLLYEKIPYQGWLPWYGIDFTILIFLSSVSPIWITPVLFH